MSAKKKKRSKTCASIFTSNQAMLFLTISTQSSFKSFSTACKAAKSLQLKEAAKQVRMWGAATIFPHEALKVRESHNQQLREVHQKHWQEYQASLRLAQRGNASALTCQGKSQKKGLWMLQKKVNLKERGAIYTLPQ